WIEHMTADESRGTGEKIRELKHLAAAGRRLNRGQRLQRSLRRDALVLKQPFHVLPRQTGARADEMFHEHLPRGVFVAELERREERGHRCVPVEFVLSV